MVITLSAQNYLVSILEKQKVGAVIRVYVVNAGTSLARCGICFSYPESFNVFDVVLDFDLFSVRVEEDMLPFLKDSIIDLNFVDKLNAQITFKAPFARCLSRDSSSLCAREGVFGGGVSLEKKIRDILELKINPRLLLHGGRVFLVDVTKDLLVILRFSGGCNGCSMINSTVKLGVESMLKSLIPELKGVCDVTDHHRGDHSYY